MLVCDKYLFVFEIFVNKFVKNIGVGKPIYTDEVPQLHYNFQWVSYYACPTSTSPPPNPQSISTDLIIIIIASILGPICIIIIIGAIIIVLVRKRRNYVILGESNPVGFQNNNESRQSQGQIKWNTTEVTPLVTPDSKKYNDNSQNEDKIQGEERESQRPSKAN